MHIALDADVCLISPFFLCFCANYCCEGLGWVQTNLLRVAIMVFPFILGWGSGGPLGPQKLLGKCNLPQSEHFLRPIKQLMYQTKTEIVRTFWRKWKNSREKYPKVWKHNWKRAFGMIFLKYFSTEIIKTVNYCNPQSYKLLQQVTEVIS